MAELTPMMRQYLEIKERHPDCILFFRLGDFYEMFADDAKLASHELDLTLTTRDRGKEKSEQVPMCGVPYHSAESYIARLVARGYKVAICEQMEDPALAKGLVKRDITRIVTPGTVIESSMLDESRNNYFACVFGEGGRYGLSFCDISTGAFYATQAEGAEAMERVISELGRFAPAEVLRGGDAAKSEELTRTLQERLSCCADLGADELFDPQETAQLVEKQFGRPLDELGLTERPEVWRSAGALLRTLCELQKTGLSHVRELEFYVSGRFMELDLSARRNLELTETMRAGEKRGSLLWVLDHTKTAMGSRMLRSWLEKPLLSPKRINARLDAVEELTKNSIGRDELVHMLQDVSDYERVTARIVTGAANCRADEAGPAPEFSHRRRDAGRRHGPVLARRGAVHDAHRHQDRHGAAATWSRSETAASRCRSCAPPSAGCMPRCSACCWTNWTTFPTCGTKFGTPLWTSPRFPCARAA